MAISHVNTTTGTQSSATSVTATKPSGTASGDLLLAFFTCNSQNATPPSGWTEIVDETVEVFRLQVFYKVAGGSEPASYDFSVESSTLLVLSVMCLRGNDISDPIDIDPSVESDKTHSEPYTTPSVTGGSNGCLVYLRAARRASSTPVTFSTSGSATERSDVGVASGNVSYSHGLYLANSSYSTSGSQSGLAITSSSSESHNIVVTLGVKLLEVPGVMDLLLPVVGDSDVSISAYVAYPAVVDVRLPLPTASINVFAGDNNGPLDVQVPVTVSMAGTVPNQGPLEVEVPVLFSSIGETRRFADNVVKVDREDRWMVSTQDGYYLGIRDIRNSTFVIDLPLISVDFTVFHITLAQTAAATVAAYSPTVLIRSAAGSVAATVQG